MRHKTPVGSTITKSRIPHGLSDGGSAITPYLPIYPRVSTCPPPSVNVFDKQVHHEVASVLLVIKVLQKKAKNPTPKISQIG
jgi:hypothetical protein